MATKVKSPPTPRLVTAEQVAQILGVTPETVRGWGCDPDSSFPRPYRFSSKLVRFSEEEVHAWIAAKKWVERIRQGEGARGGGK